MHLDRPGCASKFDARGTPYICTSTRVAALRIHAGSGRSQASHAAVWGRRLSPSFGSGLPGLVLTTPDHPGQARTHAHNAGEHKTLGSMDGYSMDTLMLYARQNRAMPPARACVPATTVPSFRSLDAARPLVAFLCSPCGARCDLGHALGLGKHALGSLGDTPWGAWETHLRELGKHALGSLGNTPPCTYIRIGFSGHRPWAPFPFIARRQTG